MKTSKYLAKLLGLYGVIVSLILVVGGSGFFTRMLEALDDPGFLLLGGIFSLVIGLAIVVGHNVWDGSWRVVITLFGYGAVLKGFGLLAWPDQFAGMSRGILEGNAIGIYAVFGLLIYGWIAWLGFRREKTVRESTVASA